MGTTYITKRDGRKEELNISKIQKVVGWACEGLSGVSESDVEMASQLKFYNGMASSDIQETLILAAAELISEDAPNYQYVASRLINYHLRKQVYNSPFPIGLYSHVTNVVNKGFYTPELLNWYTKDEFSEMDSFIDHDRDFSIVYAGMEQFRGKYLVKNRVTGQIFETPQMAYILIAATLFKDYPEDTRMNWIKQYYNAISTFEISLPTPILAGLRTNQKQFSSCVLVDSGDSIDSIVSTGGAIMKYVANKAGIGINGGRLRAQKSLVRNGDTATTGPREFWKFFQASVKSVSQGGVRSAAATLNYPIWHLDVEDFLVLKNAKGTEYNRIKHLDYCVQLNKLMYERYITEGNITLFSPHEVPGLYDAFYQDQDLFRKLYEEAEQSTKYRKKVVPAKELFDTLINERFETGRIYLMNVDHANEHGSFISDKAPVYMTNLCTEVLLPTKPLNSLDDQNESEIALCVLSAINMGKVKISQLPKVCDLAVRGLDALISYQDYLVPAAANATLNRRSLGIGITNLAYWMAKNDMTYSNPNFDKLDEYMEAMAYYTTLASVNLAEEFGPCPKWQETKYSLGITPNMTYKKDVDTLVEHKERQDWATLRSKMKEVGIRNSTLLACMPVETSSQISNSTNGPNPIPALVVTKKSQDGVLKQVVPEVQRLKNKYELKWNIPASAVIKVNAVIQKYLDQTISTNTPYNPSNTGGEVSLGTLAGDILLAYKYGLATLYYNETNDGAGEEPVTSNHDIQEEPEELSQENCEGCVL